MTLQPSLFDTQASRGASRRSDPQTSRDAGRTMAGPVLADQQALVLHALDVYCRWGDDATAYELWTFLTEHGNRIKENVLSKRLGELRERGWARETGATRPGSSSRSQMAYAITDAGRARWAERQAAGA